MSVYNKDGIQLAALYDKDGDSLLYAYDKDGNTIFSEATPYPISNVVSYFQESTLDVADAVNALSSEWKSFIFITDPHGSNNKNHSQAIGLYLLDNTDAFMIVLGGDYSNGNWVKTEYDTYVSPYLESGMMENIYAVIGNHETYGNGAKLASKVAVYGDFLEDKTNLTINQTDVYYYFDDTTNKIRYMFLNTSDSAECTMSQTQISWITSNVQLPTSEWSLLVFAHVNINNMGFTTMNETNGSDIASAIASCNGEVIGYICGHQHIDGVYDVGDFYQSMLYCDKFENTNYYSGYSETDRQIGTISEQAVSVISFNTTTKDVVIRRIGVGRNRILSYNYGQ